MFPHGIRFQAVLSIALTCFTVNAQLRKAPHGAIEAIVVDERLSVLRSRPKLDGPFLRRLPRGKLVVIKRVTRIQHGDTFIFVNVSRRTRGWILSEAVVSPSRLNDDERLLTLIRASSEFDRVVRARIFLDNFKASRHRSEVLLLLGESAEEIAARLSREASRKLAGVEGAAYYLNYAGLDRYSRKGIGFVYDEATKSFGYDGASWRELIRRYPNSKEAEEARKHLVQNANYLKQQQPIEETVVPRNGLRSQLALP